MGKLKYTYEQVKAEFEQKGYELLSTTFNGVSDKLEYICKKHEDKGIQKITFSKLHNCNQGCYYCGRERTESAHMTILNKEKDKILCQSKGFEYVDTIRENGKIIIVFICNKHRELGEQHMTRNNMKRAKGCKYCFGKDLPEWYISQKIKEINPHIKILEPYTKLSQRVDCLCTKHNCHTRKSIQEILKGQGCHYCGLEKLSAQHFLTNEQVQNNIRILNPHIKLISYKGSKEPSDFYCEKHNKYFSKYYETLIHCASGCEDCYAENIRLRCGISEDEFKNRLKDVHPELIVLGRYINNSTPIDVYCTKHDHIYTLTPVALLNRMTCCDKMRITYKEELVCKLLEEKWLFNITRQKIFEDCIDKRHLRFDIYLDDYNVLIEYQGEQHYKPIKYSSETQEEANIKFEYTKKHDEIKRQYCKDNNILLIEIPYWEFDDLEYYLFDKLVRLNIIEEIKNNAA